MKKLIGELFGIALVLLFVANLIGPISNLTIGSTATHTGFQSNQNLTFTSSGTKTNPQYPLTTANPVTAGSITPFIQLLPFVFVAILIFSVFAFMDGRISPSSSVADKSTGISIPSPEGSPLAQKSDIPAWNCINCGGPNPAGTDLCKYCGKAKGYWEYK